MGMNYDMLLLGLSAGVVASLLVSLGAVLWADHYIYRGRRRNR